MSVGRNHAVRIAALARLRFGDAELTRITAELNRILDHVEQLRTLEQTTPPPREDERASNFGAPDFFVKAWERLA